MMFWMLLWGCDSFDDRRMVHPSVSMGVQVEEEQIYDAQLSSQMWPTGFPAVQDLTLLFSGQEPVLSAFDFTTKGDVFLPYRWVNAVSDAYLPTAVGDALQWENIYEDWRLVSMRIVPCAPLGVAITQDPQELCWPMVRLVWQPVLLDYRLSWGSVPEYADDRAIHALYPLEPRDALGTIVELPIKETIEAHLKQGGQASSLPDHVYDEFAQYRDSTATWLLDQALALRGNLPMGSWSEYETRAEWYYGESEQFQNDLRLFLSQTAHPDQLRELTSFSLPEGREPAHLDTWVFLAFSGHEGNIRPVNLQVFDRETGEELINMGAFQTVGMTTEDDAVLESIAAGNTRLAEQVVVDTDDERNAQFANPNEFLVPNTSCASCHKLNHIRFDMHNLSSLEDREITVSPRVQQDVLFDQLWVKDLSARNLQ